MAMTYPNDMISGYTPAQLLSLLPNMRGNLDSPGSFMNSPRLPSFDVKSILNNNRPMHITSVQLDKLFEVYNQYWVGQWINGL